MTDNVTFLVEDEKLKVAIFERVRPNASFSLPLPGNLNVRQQLIYYSRYADTAAEPLYLRLWYSAQAIITDWKCDLIPDLKVSLDAIVDPDATDVIIWAGQQVLNYMDNLNALPKASSVPSSTAPKE